MVGRDFIEASGMGNPISMAMSALRKYPLRNSHLDFGPEQRGADLDEDLVDVGFAQLAAVAQFRDDAAEPVAQRLKHESGNLAVGVVGRDG